jgi:CRP-like cAMP-binding protein
MITNQNTLYYKPEDVAIYKKDVKLFLETSGMLLEEEKEVMSKMMQIKAFKKGTVLLEEGQIANFSYYTLKGCLREYKIKDGEEKTIKFYTKGDTIESGFSHLMRKPSKYYVECITDVVLTVLSYENDVKFKNQFPRLALICRSKTEEEFDTFREAAAEYITSSPEERYLQLMKKRPDLFELVPQYQIASYVGVTPESLSRIRNRLKAVNQLV